MELGDSHVDRELFEAIGPWTEVKHEIVREYASAYSTILSSQRTPRFHHVYVDAFAGAGRYLSRRTGLLVPGSAEIALATNPPFREYHFVDIDDVKIARLERIAGRRDDVHLYHGDCNKVLVESVFPQIRYEDYRRGLCILDPYGLHLQWNTVEAIGATGSIEVFLNFPVTDMNRNALLRDPATIDPDQALRMSAFWGDDSWRSLFYQQSSQIDLWGERPETKTVNNDLVAEAYRNRLREIAGFQFVPPPMPMRNSANAILYYLFFASHNAVAGDIVEQIFDKFRTGG